MDLADVHAALVVEIREGLISLAEPARMSELGGVFETLSSQLEGLALCHLLEFLDQEQFRENMVRSGHARRFFLRRSRLEGNHQDRHLALSRNRAFLDAVVAGSLTVARDIAVLSPDTWNGTWEYQDDFCFYLALHDVVREPSAFPTAAAHALLDRFASALEGGRSARFDVVEALVRRDPPRFAEALTALLGEEAARIDKDRTSAAVHEGDVLYWPNSRISVEGLALLNIADLIRVTVDADFPLCPPLARLRWAQDSFRDLFQDIERIGVVG